MLITKYDYKIIIFLDQYIIQIEFYSNYPLATLKLIIERNKIIIMTHMYAFIHNSYLIILFVILSSS